MNALFLATLLCLGAVVSSHPWAYAHEDGSYKGEGEAESQDYGQYDHEHGVYGAIPYAAFGPAHYTVAPAHYSVAPVQYSESHIAVNAAPHAEAIYAAVAPHAEAHYAAVAPHAEAHYAAVAPHAEAHYAAVAPHVEAHYAAIAPIHHAAYATGHYAGAYAHGAAPLGHDGQVIDTPEVAHAKAAHFAAKAAAAHAAHSGEHSDYSTPIAHGNYLPAIYSAYAAPSHYAGIHSHYAGAYAYGPAPLGPDGNVIDTPEVAHAKLNHFAAKARAIQETHAAEARAIASDIAAHHEAAHHASAHHASAHHALAYGVHAAPAYYGAYAHGAAPIGHDGRVVDTPEVAHAKAAHFAAKAAATAAVAHESHAAYGALAYGAPLAYGVHASPALLAVHAAPAYYGAYAHGSAPIGHDGHVVDTIEVAHAEAAHLAAKASAAHGDYHYGSHGQW